jgi:uncharacterized protein YqgC (DUF456 family)
MKKVRKKLMGKTGEEILDIAKKIIGIILIFLGVASLALPVLPGILLILLGVALFTNKGIRKTVLDWINQLKKKK